MNFVTLLLREIKYFTNFQNKMYQFLLFFQPLLFLAIIYFLREVRGDAESGQFVVATALLSMWTYVLYSSGSALTSLKWNETLTLLIAAPTSLFQVILTKTIANSFIALISMILSFIYGRFIFQFPIGIHNYALFFIAVLVLLISLSVVGLILAAVFTISENVYSYQNLMLTPVLLLCGVFIPVDQFPSLLQPIAYAIPMTWGIQSVYQALEMSEAVYFSMSVTLGVSFVFFVLAFLVIRKMEFLLRKSGKMGAI